MFALAEQIAAQLGVVLNPEHMLYAILLSLGRTPSRSGQLGLEIVSFRVLWGYERSGGSSSGRVNVSSRPIETRCDLYEDLGNAFSGAMPGEVVRRAVDRAIGWGAEFP